MGTERGNGPSETDKQHSLVEVLDLPELVAQLDALERKQASRGSLSRRDAVVRAAVERRILEIVCGEGPAGERRERLRVPCELDVELIGGGQTHAAVAIDVGPGGIQARTDAALSVGTAVDVQVGTNTGEHPLRVHGRVAWTTSGDEPGVGIAFDRLDRDSDVRRLWRLVLTLLHARALP